MYKRLIYQIAESNRKNRFGSVHHDVSHGRCCAAHLWRADSLKSIHIHTHTHQFNGPFSGLPTRASTRKVKPIWILLKQETVSGSGISWAICKSASCSRQITTPAPHHSVFYRTDALPAAQPTASEHWRQHTVCIYNTQRSFTSAATLNYGSIICISRAWALHPLTWFEALFLIYDTRHLNFGLQLYRV